MSDAKETQPVLAFPCQIDVKIFIHNDPKSLAVVRELVETLSGAPELKSWQQRDSRQGKYLAVTAIVWALSREQIDDLYRALVDHPQVILVI